MSTVVWNQLFEKGRAASSVTYGGCGVITFAAGSYGSTIQYWAVATSNFGTPDPTHNYILSMGNLSGSVSSGQVHVYNYNWSGGTFGLLYTPNENPSRAKSTLIHPNSVGSYFILSTTADTVCTELKFYINLFDLTLMYGAGNEPTLTEFEEMFPLDKYYQYDPGQVMELPDGAKGEPEMLLRRRRFMMLLNVEPYIVFADPVVEQICATNWGDGVGLKLSQAKRVTNSQLGTIFRDNTDIVSFDELQYFTNITGFSQYAFNGCSSLQSITLPIGITTINYYVFNGCSQLTTLSFTTPIGVLHRSFQNCSGLVYINIPDINTWLQCSFSSNLGTISHYSSSGVHLYSENTEITTVAFTSGTTSINAYALYKCAFITNVSIPSSVTSIGDGALEYLWGVSNLTIPSSITTFDSNAILSNGSYPSTGAGTGVLDIGGNFNYRAKAGPALRFKKMIIRGDVTAAAPFQSYNTREGFEPMMEQIRIYGNYVNTGYNSNGGRFFAEQSNRTAVLAFVEIMGTFTGNYSMFNTSASTIANGGIIHLGYDAYTNNAVAGTVTALNAGLARIGKIYVGKGQTAAEDNNILSVYANDTDWGTYVSSGKVDTWYNYIHSQDANPDYIN